VIYSIILGNFQTADFDFIKFAVENKCSAGPLHNAYEFVNTNIQHDYDVLSTGLFFIVAAFFVHIVIPTYQNRELLSVILFCGRNLFEK